MVSWLSCHVCKTFASIFGVRSPTYVDIIIVENAAKLILSHIFPSFYNAGASERASASVCDFADFRGISQQRFRDGLNRTGADKKKMFI